MALPSSLSQSVCVCAHVMEVKITSPSSLVSGAGPPIPLPTHDQASLLCLRPPSVPCLYPVHVHAVCLPGGTFLQSFISDGAVFQKPTLQRPVLILWGGSCPAMTRCRPVPENVCMITQQQRLCVYGKSQTHNWCQVLLTFSIFFPVSVNIGCSLGSARTFACGEAA